MAGTASVCPYVGLQPFHEEDRVYFFGRESDVRTVIDNLFAARLTIYYGASGVGKSSVLMAGVVPALRKEPRTAVVVFRDWQLPNAARQFKQTIVEAVGRALGQSVALDATRPLDELLKQASAALQGSVLLLLDQFEEYFLYFLDTAGGNEMDAELSRAVTRRDIDAGFLLSVREDNLSRLDRFRQRIPDLFGNTLRLSHLTVEAAETAIRQPLEVYNAGVAPAEQVTIEDALVREVLTQTQTGRFSLAQSGGAERSAAPAPTGRIETPFLQLVMTRLWDEERTAGSRVLRHTTLQSSLGGVERILRTHLDGTMSRLDTHDQHLCATFFDRLVTPSGSKIACSQSDLVQWAGGLGAQVPRVLGLLVENRILRGISSDTGHPMQYEIFHDVLAPGILDWQRRFRVQEAAAEQQREAERAMQLAAAQALSEQERQSAQRLRGYLAGLIVILVLAIGSALTAVKQWRDADAARRTALRAQAGLLVEKIRDTYLREHDTQKAIDELTGVLKDLDPQSWSAYLNRGLVYYDRGLQSYQTSDMEQAIADFDRALGALPREKEFTAEHAAALAARGAARAQARDLPRALNDFNAALALDPTQPDVLFARASARAADGDLRGAIGDYTAAIAIRATFDQAYLRRGELYQQLGNQAEAVADLRRAVRLARDDNTRAAAKARLAELNATSVPQAVLDVKVFIHIVRDEAPDRRAAKEAARLLTERGYNVEGTQLVPGGRTDGDVRYVPDEDGAEAGPRSAVAGEIARTVEGALATQGFRLNIRVIPLGKSIAEKANPKHFEVWLPAISATAQPLQLMAPKAAY